MDVGSFDSRPLPARPAHDAAAWRQQVGTLSSGIFFSLVVAWAYWMNRQRVPAARALT